MIALETVDSVINDIPPLLDRHWLEIAHFEDIPLDPDYPRYRLLEEKGALRIFTARDGSQLLGYAIFVVGPALHYKGSKQAVADVVFVVPERRGVLGARLLLHCDRVLTEEGVQVAYHRVKAQHKFWLPVLERMGYEIVDYTLARRLDHGRHDWTHR